jgi:hypothetical protein
MMRVATEFFSGDWTNREIQAVYGCAGELRLPVGANVGTVP